MNIAIQPSPTTRVQAYAAVHPGASPTDIGRALGLEPGVVRLALKRDRKRRVKSVAR